jgi:hypothetical protein
VNFPREVPDILESVLRTARHLGIKFRPNRTIWKAAQALLMSYVVIKEPNLENPIKIQSFEFSNQREKEKHFLPKII